jgi:hypothetical protein
MTPVQEEELGAVEALDCVKLDFVEEVYHCILYQTDDSK